MNTRRWIVLAYACFIAVVAMALRLYRLDAVPPGLQHDEVFHGHDAVTVLLGHHTIYFPSNAGNEPLYVYLTAGTIALFGRNPWGIRMAAVLCGLATVLFTGLWIRRAYNTRMALVASALVAVTFWPLFMSRVGLRSAALPPLAAATAWLFWRAVQEARGAGKRQVARFTLAGVLLGATLYTYPASRVLPIVYLLFAVAFYALRFTPHAPRSTLYGYTAFFITAGLVFLPLYLYLANAPEADVRLQQLASIGALSALQKGDAGPLLANVRDTLGMFTLRGDPVWRYNIAGEPVFNPMIRPAFYLGLFLAVWKIREPRNLFALIWLPVGLLPSILSDSAPSFLRASASLPVTFLLLALGVDWLLDHLAGERHRVWRAALIGYIALSNAFSINDYFVRWPARPEVREVYRSDLADVARWLDARTDDAGANVAPVVIASTNPHDVDPFLFDFELRRPRPIKWVDRAYGLIFPPGRALYISPKSTPLATELSDLLGVPPTFTGDSFTVYETDTPRIPPSALAAPVRFENRVDLIGYQVTPTAVKPGEWVRVWTYWRVVEDTRGEQWPTAVFAHLLDAQGQFVAGRDLLAVPTAGWRTGDVWVQFQDMQTPASAQPGSYSIEIGVYNRADMKRWNLADGTDRLLLSSVEIKSP